MPVNSFLPANVCDKEQKRACTLDMQEKVAFSTENSSLAVEEDY